MNIKLPKKINSMPKTEPTRQTTNSTIQSKIDNKDKDDKKLIGFKNNLALITKTYTTFNQELAMLKREQLNKNKQEVAGNYEDLDISECKTEKLNSDESPPGSILDLSQSIKITNEDKDFDFENHHRKYTNEYMSR